MQAAAGGEEILITVRGEPRARLIGVAEIHSNSRSRNDWVKEIVQSAKKSAGPGQVGTSQKYWDDSRADRY